MPRFCNLSFTFAAVFGVFAACGSANAGFMSGMGGASIDADMSYPIASYHNSAESPTGVVSLVVPEQTLGTPGEVGRSTVTFSGSSVQEWVSLTTFNFKTSLEFDFTAGADSHFFQYWSRQGANFSRNRFTDTLQQTMSGFIAGHLDPGAYLHFETSVRVTNRHTGGAVYELDDGFGINITEPGAFFVPFQTSLETYPSTFDVFGIDVVTYVSIYGGSGTFTLDPGLEVSTPPPTSGVPEPSSLALAGVASIMCLGLRFRRGRCSHG